LFRGAGFTPIRERVEKDAADLATYERSQQKKQQDAAIQAYLDNPNEDTRQGLRDAKVTSSMINSARKKAANGKTVYERAQGTARRNKNRQSSNTLRNYISMLE
jgi:hypothetical protein